jgi:hypothetical protein
MRGEYCVCDSNVMLDVLHVAQPASFIVFCRVKRILHVPLRPYPDRQTEFGTPNHLAGHYRTDQGI